MKEEISQAAIGHSIGVLVLKGLIQFFHVYYTKKTGIFEVGQVFKTVLMI